MRIGPGIAYPFTGSRISFFDKGLSAARAKSDPIEMLQMRKADA